MLFLDALTGKNYAKRPPVWLMRQAGRYMHEYQAVRKRYDFLTICHTPELICEVTHQPITAFGFDAAIVFSDILLILEALGFSLRFEDAQGPIIDNPLPQGRALAYSEVVPKLEYVLEGISLLKKSLTVPLIGFAGAPFTLASYLIEGKSNRDLARTKKWLLEDPASFDKLLDVLADCTIDYLNAQIDRGVDAIQIFDSWAIYLGENEFERFVKRPLDKILKGLKPCPVILFCRGSSIEKLSAIHPHVLSVDWTMNIQELRKQHPTLVLQGNLDPELLLTTRGVVETKTKELLDSMKYDPAYICNLGHGVLKNTPREAVEALVAAVKSYG